MRVSPVWLMIAVFAAFLTFVGLFPVITPYSLALGASISLSAWIAGAYSIANILGSFAGGYWIQRHGPARMLLIGLWLTAFNVALYAAAWDALSLLAVRALHGFATAWVAPAAFALAAVISSAQRRGQGMGRVGAGIGLAAIVGPPLSGVLASRLGERWVFLVIAVIVALATLVIHRRLIRAAAGFDRPVRDETVLRDDEDESDAGQAGGPAGSWRIMLAERGLWLAWLAAVALPLLLGVLAWYLPVAAEDLGLSAGSGSGIGLGVFAIVASLVMASPIANWSNARGYVEPLLAGMILNLAAMLLWQLPSLGAFAAAAVVFGAGFGIVFPTANALLASAVPRVLHGIAFAAFYALYSVGASVGPPLAAGLQAQYGWHPFIGAALAGGVILLLMVGFGRGVRR